MEKIWWLPPGGKHRKYLEFGYIGIQTLGQFALDIVFLIFIGGAAVHDLKKIRNLIELITCNSDRRTFGKLFRKIFRIPFFMNFAKNFLKNTARVNSFTAFFSFRNNTR